MSGRLSAENQIDRGAVSVKIVFLAIGFFVMVSGIKYGLTDSNGLVGAGLMPFVAGAVTLMASIWELAKGFLSTSSREDSHTESASGSWWTRYGSVIKVFAVILFTIALTRVIGLLLALCLMMAVLIIAVERRPWWTGLVAAAIGFAFGYGVFVLVLHVPLPTGLLGLV